MKHLTKRIQIARNENSTPESSKYVVQYISELQKDIDKLAAERAEVGKLATSPEPTPDHIQLIRDRLKDFSVRIKIEPTDIQYKLIRQYVDTIMYDEFSKNYKLKFHVDLLGDDLNTSIKILEKTVYFILE